MDIIKGDASDSAKVMAYTFFISNKIKEPKAALESLYEMRSFCEKKIANPKIKALCLRKMGILYANLNYFDKALECTFKSAEIFESLNDKIGLSNCYNNIGSYYHNKGNFTMDKSFHNRAIEYHLKAMDLRAKFDPDHLHNSYNNIGSTYLSMEEYEKALEYFDKAYVAYVKFGDANGIELISTNLGDCYLYLGLRNNSTPHLRKGLSFFLQILKNAPSDAPNERIAGVLNSVGQIYIATGNKPLGVSYLKKGMDMADLVHDKNAILTAAKSLAQAYESDGDYKKALEMIHIVNANKDSLLNEKSSNSIEEMQAFYQTSQKDREIEKLNEEKRVTNSELSRSRTIIFSSVGVAGLILILVFVLWKRSFTRRKANADLAQAYVNIEKKNKQITDSINYSKRIQSAILPPTELVSKSLANFFIYYTPKDIVSGDFYWFAENNSKLFFIVADCTGHGVPGALMSMIGNTLLNEIVNQNDVSDPGEILNQLNKGVKHALRQRGSDLVSQDDGMDVSVCCIDKKGSSVLKYACANHSIFVKANLPTGQAGNKVTELTGDIYSIGGDFGNTEKSFTSKMHTLEQNSFIVMSTDGYYDQFGGPKNAKFLMSRFEELISNTNLEDQNASDLFAKAITNWRGDMKQTDDILVAGFKV